MSALDGFDAVVLAGGGGRRLGGVDKAGVVVAGQALLDRVLAACAGARRTVVVGVSRPTARPVEWTREDPPSGGPLAALAAGLARLEVDFDGHSPAPPRVDRPVVVLATDLPWLAAADVGRLVRALEDAPEADGALFADTAGRLQPLTAVYRSGRLQAATRAVGPLHGRAVRLVLDTLVVVSVPDRGAAADCDTPDQLAAARAHFDR